MAMKWRKSRFSYEKNYERKYLKKQWKQVLVVIILLIITISVLLLGMRRNAERQRLLEQQSAQHVSVTILKK